LRRTVIAIMPLAPGTRLGPYEIVGLAGTGGLAEVYEAHDTRLRRAVALKIATRPFGDDRETRTQFEREARAIAAVNHPRICAIHDVATFDGQDVIVMEYHRLTHRAVRRCGQSLPRPRK
jgi:serine/threonine protein kinase